MTVRLHRVRDRGSVVRVVASRPRAEQEPTGIPTSTTSASPLLAACRGEPHERVPVWFMRQAGRALPEYRAVRARHSFQEVVADPELAAEVTLQPVRRYGVDAAILFSDIVTPVQALGVGVEIVPGTGPVVAEPFRTPADLDRLRPFEPDVDAPYVAEAVALVAAELGATPVIGFAGAPFTVASYLVEGGPSRSHTRTKALLHREPGLWDRLMSALADVTIASLRAQVAAGARAVQVFDSWAGTLAPADYARAVLPWSSRVFAGLADLDVPRIHFGVATGELLGLMAAAGADVVGIDWRVPLDDGVARLPPDVSFQGNLDPAVVLGGWEATAPRVRDVLARAGGSPRHVFNLGHGVLPDLDPGVLAEVVALVHAEGRADGTLADGVVRVEVGPGT